MERFDRRPPVAPRDALVRLLDGAQTLFREHLALAKAELRDDVRRTGRNLLLSAAGLPPLFVGYVLLMVALALVLRLVVDDWAAFGIWLTMLLQSRGNSSAATANGFRRCAMAAGGSARSGP